MNKYEILFNEISDQTKLNQLKWTQIKRYSNSELIFNPNLIFRQFSSEFIKNGNEFKLIFIEKKYEDPESDFAYEKYTSELMIIDSDGELITTITDSIIPKHKMLRLADMIESRSDKINKLFDNS